MSFFRLHKDEYVKTISECLKDRIKLQHTQVLTDALHLLATQGWGRSEESYFATGPINDLANRFSIPLEKYGVDISALGDDWIDMIDYAKDA